MLTLGWKLACEMLWFSLVLFDIREGLRSKAAIDCYFFLLPDRFITIFRFRYLLEWNVAVDFDLFSFQSMPLCSLAGALKPIVEIWEPILVVGG